MRLSRKSEYACLALLDLSESYSDSPSRIKDISFRKDIPKKYLEQILLLLKGAGIVKSRRGVEGGYLLARDPSEITVAEVIRLIDGPLAPVDSVSHYFYDATPIEKSPALLALFQEIRDMIANRMEAATFSELLELERAAQILKSEQ